MRWKKIEHSRVYIINNILFVFFLFTNKLTSISKYVNKNNSCIYLHLSICHNKYTFVTKIDKIKMSGFQYWCILCKHTFKYDQLGWSFDKQFLAHDMLLYFYLSYKVTLLDSRKLGFKIFCILSVLYNNFTF